MTVVFVLRHPETTWNRVSRYQGRLDTPLSEEGQKQLEARAHSFHGTHLDCVFSSPLSRAHRLAQAVAAETSTTLHVDARWTEIGQGVWEGLYIQEIKARYSDLFRKWHTRPDLVTFPGGESLEDVERRIRPALDEVFRAFQHGMVAIVTHSVVAQLIISRSLRLETRHLHSVRASNAGLSVLYGREAPGNLLTLNSVESIYSSPVDAARALGCAENGPRSQAS